MQRRAFLSLLLKGAAGFTAAAALPAFDPERALWVPGARTYFDMGAGDDYSAIYWTGNNFLTSDIITREALAVLKNHLNFASRVHRSYDDRFGETALTDAASGLRIRIPDRYVALQRQREDDIFKATINYELRDLVFINPRHVARIDG